MERKLVSRVVNPRGNREVLVSLTRSGLAVHDVMVPGLWSAPSACGWPWRDEFAALMAQLERLTKRAEEMLAAKRDLS